MSQERCDRCGALYALVGTVHRCVPRIIEELPPHRRAKVKERALALIDQEIARSKKQKAAPKKREST